MATRVGKCTSRHQPLRRPLHIHRALEQSDAHSRVSARSCRRHHPHRLSATHTVVAVFHLNRPPTRHCIPPPPNSPRRSSQWTYLHLKRLAFQQHSLECARGWRRHPSSPLRTASSVSVTPLGSCQDTAAVVGVGRGGVGRVRFLFGWGGDVGVGRSAVGCWWASVGRDEMGWGG